eukprot:scaffold24557_cov74-Phaeocystis_antarctica.AAC.5
MVPGVARRGRRTWFPLPWPKPSTTHSPCSLRTVAGLAAASRSQCGAALGRQGPGRGARHV